MAGNVEGFFHLEVNQCFAIFCNLHCCHLSGAANDVQVLAARKMYSGDVSC